MPPTCAAPWCCVPAWTISNGPTTTPNTAKCPHVPRWTAWLHYAPFHLRNGTWDDSDRDALADLALRTLQDAAPNIANTVVGREVLTPLDLETRFGLSEGQVFQGEVTLDQMMFMRPVPGWSHYRTPLAGLYMCGCATHPGGGITGQSGRLAARQVVRDMKKRGVGRRA